MPKVKIYSVDKREKYRLVEELFEIIADLRTRDEVYNFLTGLFTASEALMIARRIQIARMLLEEQNFEIIRRKLKVSYQTINKVEHWLRRDETKNKLIANKILKTRKTVRGNGEGNILNKYAHHRFLKELFS
jgi:TrpR-related protein YerC/YecD